MKLFSQFYDTKPHTRTRDFLKEHKSNKSRFQQISRMPIVLAHSPTRESIEWNKEKSDRLQLDPSYESTLSNLRYLRHQ